MTNIYYTIETVIDGDQYRYSITDSEFKPIEDFDDCEHDMQYIELALALEDFNNLDGDNLKLLIRYPCQFLINKNDELEIFEYNHQELKEKNVKTPTEKFLFDLPDILSGRRPKP